MAGMEKLNTYSLVCEGGLDSNRNHIALASQTPGAATTLINFEPSLFGGYRKINGFAPLETDYSTIDAAGSEGKILGVHVLESDIIVARKTQSTTTYKFFYWTSGADWTAFTTGLTHTATGVDKIRAVSYNLQGPNSAIFVDGVNNAVLYNGTNWTKIDPSDTGLDFANAGGNQALGAPKYVTTFKNHLFVSGDDTNPQLVAHSAPETDYDWLTASGAGQLNVGFDVLQIKPFRDALYVFGKTKIKKIVVEGTDFVIKDVTNNGGLIASDSVVEVNGDLLFLAADGFRTVAATERNEDVELGVVSKKIQQNVTELIASADFLAVSGVVIRRKSQVRFFLSDENLDTYKNQGVIGGLKGDPGNASWEWGLLRGIRVSCVTSAYIGNQEYVIHGDYNGKVYRQEIGSSFDGANILAVYTTPYIDFGDTFTRKTLHKIMVFIRPENEVQMSMQIRFDWGDTDILSPRPYLLESNIEGELYGTAVYGTSRYATSPPPVVFKNVEGSHFSNSITFTSSDTQGSFSIQAIVYEYSVNGRK